MRWTSLYAQRRLALLAIFVSAALLSLQTIYDAIVPRPRFSDDCSFGPFCTGDELEVCVNGRKCGWHCMVVGGSCVRNPRVIVNPNATMFDELVCDNKPPPARPPPIDADAADPVAIFKNRTAWAFEQWWNWEGQCVPPTSVDDAKFRIRRDENAEFIMDNVCVRAAGNLAGFGRDPNEATKWVDVRDEVDAAQTQGNAFAYLNNVEQLPYPPPCFVDANVILIALDYRANNVVHALHRFHQVALMQRFHFPTPDDPPHSSGPAPTKRPRRSTIVGHVWLHQAFDFPGDAMRYFFPLMGDAWFSVFGMIPDRETLERPGYRSRLFGVDAQTLARTALCFRSVLIAHACTGDNCLLPFRDIPGSRYRLSFVTPRTPYDTFVLEWTRQRFAKCLGITAPKARANVTHPIVLVAFRSASRRFGEFPLLAPGIVKHLQTRLGAATVYFMEHTRFTPRETIEMHMNADVLIGVFGGQMGWTTLLPAGGVVLEMVGSDFGCPHERRVHGFFNPVDCEYGGYAAARGLRHYHLPIDALVKTDYRVSAPTWRFALDTAMCALRWEPSRIFLLPVSTMSEIPMPLYTLGAFRREYASLWNACDTGGVNPARTLPTT